MRHGIARNLKLTKTIFSRQGSVLLKWLLSYALVLVIPLFIFIGSMFQSMRIIAKEINYSNSLLLEKVQLSMDHTLYETSSLASEVFIDPSLKKLFESDERSTVTRYELYEAISSLQRFAVTKLSIKDFFLYFPTVDIVVNNTTYNKFDEFYGIYLATYGMDRERWHSLISRTYRTTQIVKLSMDGTGNPSDAMLIVKPIRMGNNDRMYANVVFFVNSRDFLLAKREPDDGKQVLILSNENNVLYFSSSEAVDQEIIGKIGVPDDKSFTEEVQVENSRFVMSTIPSRYSDWRYAVIVDKVKYLSKLETLKRLYASCLVLCFLTGIALIIVLLKRNYNPLRGIMNEVEGFVPKKSGDTVNEYQYISEAISSLRNENRTVTDLMRKQKDLLRSQMILDLVENYDNADEEDQKLLQTYGIEFKSDEFLVLIYSVYGDEGPFNSNNDLLLESQKDELFFLILQNITDDLFGKAGIRTYAFRSDHLVGFILNPPELADDRTYQKVRTLLGDVKNAIDRNFNFQFKYACSNIQRSFGKLSVAYAQALEVLEYKNMLELDDVLFYSEIEGQTREKSFYYPFDVEIEINNHLKKGDEAEVVRIINDVVLKSIKQCSSPEMMRYLMVNLAGTILKVVSRMDETLLTKIPQFSFHSLMEGGSVTDMVVEMGKMVHEICALVNGHISDECNLKDRETYNRVVSYIRENFTDKNLNVSGVADALHMQIVSLSRLFRRCDGDSLSSYINKVRLERAKELISAGSTLEDACEATGYGSLRTFMRVFKKYEGITPGQYKEMSMAR